MKKYISNYKKNRRVSFFLFYTTMLLDLVSENIKQVEKYMCQMLPLIQERGTRQIHMEACAYFFNRRIQSGYLQGNT